MLTKHRSYHVIVWFFNRFQNAPLWQIIVSCSKLPNIPTILDEIEIKLLCSVDVRETRIQELIWEELSQSCRRKMEKFRLNFFVSTHVKAVESSFENAKGQIWHSVATCQMLRVCRTRSHPNPTEDSVFFTFSPSSLLVHCTSLMMRYRHPSCIDKFNISLLFPDHCHNYYNLHHLHLPRSILLESGENYLPLFLVICGEASQKLVVTGRTLHPQSHTFFVATNLFPHCNDGNKEQGRPGIRQRSENGDSHIYHIIYGTTHDQGNLWTTSFQIWFGINDQNLLASQKSYLLTKRQKNYRLS